MLSLSYMSRSFTLHVVSVLHISSVRLHYMLCLSYTSRSFVFTTCVYYVLHVSSVRLHYMCFCVLHITSVCLHYILSLSYTSRPFVYTTCVFTSYTFRCSHLWHDVSPSYTQGVSSRCAACNFFRRGIHRRVQGRVQGRVHCITPGATYFLEGL